MDEDRKKKLNLTFLDKHGRYIEGQGRPEPPSDGDEASTLLGYLERQRATFAWNCGGLDAEQLRRTLGPSPITLGGMIKHLTRFEDDMSTEWLQGKDQIAPWNAVDWKTEQDWDWRSAAKDSPEGLYAEWQMAVIRSRALFNDALADGGPGRRANERVPNVRTTYLNMIEEYARHNGQADLIRESIDGLVGQDPPE